MVGTLEICPEQIQWKIDLKPGLDDVVPVAADPKAGLLSQYLLFMLEACSNVDLQLGRDSYSSRNGNNCQACSVALIFNE